MDIEFRGKKDWYLIRRIPVENFIREIANLTWDGVIKNTNLFDFVPILFIFRVF